MGYDFRKIILIGMCFIIAACDDDVKMANEQEHQQITKIPFECQYMNENTPINLYISEKWLSDRSSCLSGQRKLKIEEDLYSFVKKLPASQVKDNYKYYKLLTVISPENKIYKDKTEKYKNIMTDELEYLEGLYSLIIPSDKKAIYKILEINKERNNSTIVTKRVGQSFTSFSKRLYNCQKRTVKYLGSGSSLIEMNLSKPDSKMGNIVNRSIAFYIFHHACRDYNFNE